MNDLSAVLTKLIGDRSIRQTASDCGVAASYISGIIKGKYLPTPNILVKLSKGNPQNGVTLDDSMKACGYVETTYSIGFTLSEIDALCNILNALNQMCEDFKPLQFKLEQQKSFIQYQTKGVLQNE